MNNIHFKQEEKQRQLRIVVCEDGEVIVQNSEFTHLEYIGLMTTLFYDGIKKHANLQSQILQKEMD